MANIDQLVITSPCSASWEEMDGDDRARFCKLCRKVVHDSTGLTSCELERMLASPTPPCVRVHRDLRGRVLTRDRLAAIAAVGLAACTGGSPDSGLDTGDTAPADRVAVSAQTHDARTMGTGDGAARTRTLPESGFRALMDAWNARVRGTGEKAGIPETTVPETVVPDERVPTMGEPAMPPPPPTMGGVVAPHHDAPAPAVPTKMGKIAVRR